MKKGKEKKETGSTNQKSIIGGDPIRNVNKKLHTSLKQKKIKRRRRRSRRAEKHKR